MGFLDSLKPKGPKGPKPPPKPPKPPKPKGSGKGFSQTL